MKTFPLSSRRGSALVSVLMLTLALTIIIASVLSYSLNERRLNFREQVRLEARNAAEAISEYGLAQVRQLMESRSDFTATRFTSNQSQIAMPAASFWAGSNVVESGTNAPELVVGLINQVSSSGTSLYYFDPADPNNEFEPLKGRYAFRFDIRVLSRATVVPPAGGGGANQTIYMTQTLSARASPLFSHAIFYNMDLELWPGPTMNILGGVHTNGSLYVKKQSSDGRSLNFVGPVTVAGGGNVPVTSGRPAGIYAGVKVPITFYNGSTDNLSSYTDNVFFTTPGGGLGPLYGPAPGTSSPSLWRDQKWGQSSESIATNTAFRTWTAQTFQGNLLTPVHGVQVANPPGIGRYVEDPSPSNGVDDSINDARKIIEPPLVAADAGYNAEVESQKYSRLCGVYIVANPSTITRTGRTPTGATVNIPAGAYRAFDRFGSEIVLPGQPTYGTNNATANATGNIGGPPVVRIRSNAMTDMRRANFNWSAVRSASNPFSPQQIDMIDIDMTALKLAVDRTINGLTSTQVYRTATPADGTARTNAAWTGFIYNNLASGTGASVLPAATTLSAVHDINYPSGGTLAAATWNGGLYIESVDADAAPSSSVFRGTSHPSGVRLINGRGPVASKGGEGLTIATNDAVYILGHYNANGFIDATATAGNTVNNGRFPDSVDETPCSIACDAITILSAPHYVNNGTNITQTHGWNDATSSLRLRTSGYTSAWATTALSNSNLYDGGSSSTNPYRVPYDSSSGALTNSTSVRFEGANTEISSAFLAGIVVSNKDGNGQNSGGANNYPRFNEDFWTSNPQKTVCIRGSIVAMYESRAAREPWVFRTFNAPVRLWGFHSLFASGRFPPLTPRVMSYRRVDFNDIPKATYDSVKASWGL